MFAFTFFCSLSVGPYVVVENFGNWKTLSFNSKSAYITGLWDSYMAFFRDDIAETYEANCLENGFTRISDLVEVVNSLYSREINKSMSPAILLKEKGLKHLCAN